MRNQIIYSGLTVLALAGQAKAAPTAYSNGERDVKVYNNTNSMTLLDSEDQRTIWVMPPMSGVGTAEVPRPGANIGFCKEMSDLQSSSRHAAGRLDQFHKEAEKLLIKQMEAISKLEEAEKQNAALKNNPALKHYENLEDREKTLERNIAETLETLEGLDCNEFETRCKQLEKEYDAQKEERKQLRIELRQARNDNRTLIRECRDSKAEVEGAQSLLENINSSIDVIDGRIIQTRQKFIDLYKDFAQFEGGFVEVFYESDWDKNIERLNQDNGNNFRFEKINTQNARVYGAITGAQDKLSYMNSLPMILDYTINGKAYVPYGEGDANSTVYPAYPDGAKMSLRLSLVGACAQIHPEYFDLTSAEMPTFSVGVTYEHPALYRREVKVKFNLVKIYEQIKRSGTKGGFFSRKSWSEVIEKHWSKENFEIHFYNEDPNNPWDDEYKQTFIKEIKAELIARVLQKMATPTLSGTLTPLPNMPIPPSGAQVFSDGLMKTCGYSNIYCAAGSWILRGLDAVFGSQSVEQRFYQKHDHTIEEDWRFTEARWRPAASILGNRKN